MRFSTSKPMRWAVLLSTVAAMIVSSGQVLHAHVEGNLPHRLEAGHHHASREHGLGELMPVSWHAHVHLLGLELHVPISDPDESHQDQIPGDLAPSWSNLPTLVEAFDQQPMSVEPSLALPFCVVALVGRCLVPVQPGMSHSGLSPGLAGRLALGSLTL